MQKTDTSNERRKIILDCDVGVDDAVAILFAHYSPGIDLVGITTGFGNASVSTTTRNALYVKEKFDIPAPVHRGAPFPLYSGYDHHTVHGADGLGDCLGTIRPNGNAEGIPAALYIANTIMENPGEITVVCIATSTNLALARMFEPKIADNVREIVVMTGAAGLDGEMGNSRPVAEANSYGDPHANDIVFRTDWPVTMVGLDVTYNSGMDQTYLDELESHGGEAGRFLKRINQGYMIFNNATRKEGLIAYQHDSMAVAYVIDPTLFRTRRGRIQVVTEGFARGQTVFCPEEHHSFDTPEWSARPVHDVCSDVDGTGFLDLYRRTLADATTRST